MPTFVPVTNPEKSLREQDESELSKHRNFDSTVVARQKRGWQQGTVGWGVQGTWGSTAKDDGAQVVREQSRGNMVRNEKGLWVKAATRVRRRDDEEEYRRRSRSRERDRASRHPRDDGRGHRRDDRRHRHDDRRSRDEYRREVRGDKARQVGEDDDRGRPREARNERTDHIRERSVERQEKTTSPGEEEEVPSDFKFSCSQLVDRVLEIFNSDAPAGPRSLALSSCFESLVVAPLRQGERPPTMSGDRAVDAVVSARSVQGAEPKVRIFMEAGGGEEEAREGGDGEDEVTFCLDLYPVNCAPGLSAVVKGKPADTFVLWRATKNKITHAYVAPDRDGNFGANWAAVTETAIVDSKRVMGAVNELLTIDLPQGREYWEFHFNNYTTDVQVVGA